MPKRKSLKEIDAKKTAAGAVTVATALLEIAVAVEKAVDKLSR